MHSVTISVHTGRYAALARPLESQLRQTSSVVTKPRVIIMGAACSRQDPVLISLERDLHALEVVLQQFPTLDWNDETAVLVHSAFNTLRNQVAGREWSKSCRKRRTMVSCLVQCHVTPLSRRTSASLATRVSFAEDVEVILRQSIDFDPLRMTSHPESALPTTLSVPCTTQDSYITSDLNFLEDSNVFLARRSHLTQHTAMTMRTTPIEPYHNKMFKTMKSKTRFEEFVVASNDVMEPNQSLPSILVSDFNCKSLHAV